jgi:hypothetical protein
MAPSTQNVEVCFGVADDGTPYWATDQAALARLVAIYGGAAVEVPR